jgi:hypothetical protein
MPVMVASSPAARMEAEILNHDTRAASLPAQVPCLGKEVKSPAGRPETAMRTTERNDPPAFALEFMLISVVRIIVGIIDRGREKSTEKWKILFKKHLPQVTTENYDGYIDG